MSHDLKTPLNSTQLMLHTIKECLKNKSTLNHEDIESKQIFIHLDILQHLEDIFINN